MTCDADNGTVGRDGNDGSPTDSDGILLDRGEVDAEVARLYWSSLDCCWD